MTIVSFASIHRKRQFTLFIFLLTLLLIPFQKPMKGFFAHLVKSLTPSSLILPPYFSKQLLIFPSDLCILVFLGAFLIFVRPTLSRFFWQGPSKYLTCLFFASLLSLFFSKTALYPLQYVKLFYFSLYFLLFCAIRISTPFLDLRALLKGTPLLFVTVGAFEGGIAISQYFSQSSLGLTALGEMSVNHFPLTYTSSALHSGTSSLSEILFRASGTFTHPNILGCVLFCGILSSLYLLQKKETVLLRSLLFVALFVQLTALYLSFSRSALLAALVAIPLFYSLLIFSSSIAKSAVMKIFAFLMTGVIALTIIFFPALSARGGIVNYQGPAKGADTERLYYCKIAIKMIAEHPLFGVGYNNFQLYSQPEYSDMPHHYFHSKVHNIFLLIGAETGLIGLTLFSLFLFHALFPALRQRKLKQFAEERAWLLALVGGMLCMGLLDFFLLYNSIGLILFFSITGLLYITTIEAKNG